MTSPLPGTRDVSGKQKRVFSSGLIQQLFWFVLLCAALFFLRQELKDYPYRALLQDLFKTPFSCLLLAVFLTLVNYFVIASYDFAALRVIRHPLKLSQVLFASMLSTAFGNVSGNPAIAGGPVRFRLYSGWGLTSLEITKVVGFTYLVSTLGLICTAGFLFFFYPHAIPVPMPQGFFSSTQTLGVLFLGITAAYLALVLSPLKSLKIKGWSLELPGFAVSVSQCAAAALDWALAASVLYVLLPKSAGLGFETVLAAFLFAQIAGILSHVPAGLGVFEAVMIAFLGAKTGTENLLPALVVFRGVYYLLPFCLGALFLSFYEITRGNKHFKQVSQSADKVLTALAPNLLALTTFAAGILLIVSGATPAATGRLVILRDFVPLPVIEVSHFLGSVAGIALLFLAHGIQRRLDSAFYFTVTLLATGIVVSLAKGFDYEEAVILSVMLAALLPSRKVFYRQSSLLNEPFTPRWFLSIAAVISVSLWIFFFVYQHVDYSHELWWQFSLKADAPRSLRALLGMTVFILAYAISRLMKTARAPKPGGAVDFRNVYEIVLKSKDIEANLALTGDKAFLFNKAQTAFIMYGVQGKSFVALGDPVGPEETWPELVWNFRALADRHEGWTVFSEVGHEHLYLYLDAGLSLIKLGEEARVDLKNFSLEGGANKELRYVLSKNDKDGLEFEFVEKERVRGYFPEMKVVSDAWLSAKKTREKGFSLGFYDETYLSYFPCIILKWKGKVIAFANIWQSASKEEFSIDLMRYIPGESPKSVMDYLFIRLMLWGREQGYAWFNMGMAPLAGLENRSFAPLWNRVGGMVYRHGAHFYNFQGLRAYKEKFHPVWRSKYLASPGGLALPKILTDISALGSGGYMGIFSK